MTKEINKQEQAKRQSGLWISLAAGLVLVVGLITMGGCSRNGANSNTNLSPGTVVKNSGGMEFAYIPPGNFQMGSEVGDTRGNNRPVHQVTFASGFYMGRYEVTEAQWQKVMGNKNPSNCGENCPVRSVSWDDAQEFIQKMNAQNDGYAYRLPSEAEWEYACRAGTTGNFAGDIKSMAWYQDTSDSKLHPVGQKQPNVWGLYDMHGNVSEWVMDNSHDNYNGAPTDGSAWTSGGDSNNRVWRGGSYRDADLFTSSFSRNWGPSDGRDYRQGFRVVAVPQSK